VFENMVLGKMFGPRRDEVTGEWSKLHNEELNDVYCSPNIARVIKSRRIRYGDPCTGFWWGNMWERDQWGDPGVDGRIILRGIFGNLDVGIWTGSSWLRIGTGGGHL